MSGLKNKLRDTGIQIAVIATDIAFLIGWFILQFFRDFILMYIIGFFTKKPQLFGINEHMFLVFQTVFAVSTLAAVIIWLSRDISIMIIRARREIRREIELDKTGGKSHEKRQ